MLRPNSYKQAFRVAFFGIYYVFRTQRNFRIHLVITLLTMAMAYWVQFERWEWLLLILTIAMVLVAEMFNSAIELLASAWYPKQHIKVKLIKDMAAGAVLLAALWAFCIGIFLFLPHFILF